MYTFNLAKVSKLGEFDEKYGQRYWCEITEDLMPVCFNSLNKNIAVGQTISAEEKALKKSARGVEYTQLRKVRVTASEPENPSQAPQNTSKDESYDILVRIEQKLDKLLGDDEKSGYAQAQAVRATLGEDPTDEPINPDDIPY